jgi:hypothetical protein
MDGWARTRAAISMTHKSVPLTDFPMENKRVMVGYLAAISFRNASIIGEVVYPERLGLLTS